MNRHFLRFEAVNFICLKFSEIAEKMQIEAGQKERGSGLKERGSGQKERGMADLCHRSEASTLALFITVKLQANTYTPSPFHPLSLSKERGTGQKVRGSGQKERGSGQNERGMADLCHCSDASTLTLFITVKFHFLSPSLPLSLSPSPSLSLTHSLTLSLSHLLPSLALFSSISIYLSISACISLMRGGSGQKETGFWAKREGCLG